MSECCVPLQTPRSRSALSSHPHAGVADQLQTNFASDLRSILKTVFKIVASPAETSEETGGNSA